MVWIAAVLGLLALGTWQVQRRAWKLDLIARVDAGMKAAPVAAPANAGRDDAYRRVTASGSYLPGKDSFVQASTVRGPGWWVITPLQLTEPLPGEGRGPVAEQQETAAAHRNNNLRDWTPASAGEQASGELRHPKTILINRGYVPERHAARPPAQPVTIIGFLRLTEPGGGFLRSNDPAADRWYSRDVAAIARSRALANPAPYFIDADATNNAPGQPVGGLTVVAFSNNHLVYAITWYVLAMMTAAGFYYWITLLRRRGRTP
nr:SURF1 family protein [Sphingomonas sp. ZFBP2030]